MIIEELKSFLRATVLMSTDMTKKEFSLELLEKIIAMEQKLKSMEPIHIDPPVQTLPAGVIKPRPPFSVDSVDIQTQP